MSLVEGSSALQQTVEVANTLKVVSETTQQTAEIYSISQYLTETQADQPQAALGAWKYVESLQAYVPQVVTGLTAAAGGAYTAVAGGVAYVLSVPAAFCAIAGALGVGVGVGMYQLNPDFWTGLSNALVDAGCMVGSGVLAIVKDGKNYIPQTTIEVVKDYLISSGAYESGGVEVDDPQTIQGEDLTEYFDTPIIAGTSFTSRAYNSNTRYTSNILQSGAFSIVFENENPTYEGYPYTVLVCADTDEVLENWTSYNIVTGETETGTDHRSLNRSFTYGGLTVYYRYYPSQTDGASDVPIQLTKKYFPDNSNSYPALAWNIVYGGTPTGGVEGLEKESGATYPDETKTIPEEYPSWANDGMTFLRPKTREIGENPVLDPDNVEEVRALPVEIPTIEGNPANEGLEEGQQVEQGGVIDAPPVVGPVPPAWKRIIVGIDDLIDVDPPKPPLEDDPPILDIPENTDPPVEDPPVDPPTDNGGVTPAVIPPTDGVNTGMNNVYNPTKAEMREFNAFLWSNDFIDTIKKILNDPMQAVIALQIVYVTPPTESGHTIVVGSIDTEVSSDIVTSQYVSINCGSVSIPEYFKDYTDYSPYTQVSCYLPFIGFVQLDTDDIVGSTVSIEYTVDLFTGTCLAEITVTKGNMSAVLYTFNGNCAVQLPLTSATHSSIVGTLTGVSTALLGVSTGNPLLALGGIASAGMSYAKNDISRSGSLGSNAGAMGIKKPYILVRRPVAYNAERYNEYIGIPSNKTVVLSTLTGYTRVQETHVENIAGATDREKDMILTALKEGVIL